MHQIEIKLRPSITSPQELKWNNNNMEMTTGVGLEKKYVCFLVTVRLFSAFQDSYIHYDEWYQSSGKLDRH